jgi:hypothetical protein
MRIGFLVYENRSGSTFLASHLDRIEGVVVLPETDFVRLAMAELPRGATELSASAAQQALRRDDKLSSLVDVPLICSSLQHRITVAELLKRVAIGYLRQSDLPDAETVIVKGNVLDYMATLQGSVERTFFLGVVRDGRAVYASQRRTPSLYGNRVMNDNPISSALSWARKTSQMRSTTACHVIRYEDLIDDPLSAVESATSFMGMVRPLAATNSGYFHRLPESHKSIHSLVSSEVGRLERISAWRRDVPYDELEVYELFAREWLLAEGYLPMTKPTFNGRIAAALARQAMRAVVRSAGIAVFNRQSAVDRWRPAYLAALWKRCIAAGNLGR